MPNEYEDIIAVNRSTLSFNSEIFKMSNLVSFNPKNTNEVNISKKIINYNSRLIALHLMDLFICLQLITKQRIFQKYMNVI